MSDRHNTRRIRNLLAIIVSAFFAVVGVAGFQRTGDPLLLLAFVLLAAISAGLVCLIFRGVNWLLDSLDGNRRQ